MVSTDVNSLLEEMLLENGHLFRGLVMKLLQISDILANTVYFFVRLSVLLLQRSPKTTEHFKSTSEGYVQFSKAYYSSERFLFIVKEICFVRKPRYLT